MKLWKANCDNGKSFDVIARTKELAFANAVNIAAMLFLEYGIVIKVREVVEA